MPLNVIPRIAIPIGAIRPFFLFSNACRKVKMSAGRSFVKGRSRMQSYPSNDRGQYGDRMNAEGFHDQVPARSGARC